MQNNIMKKLTITIKNNISDEQALNYVLRVVKNGRISKNNKSYCHCTLFENQIVVLADNNKNDTFIIQDHVF
jgi:hypothetical protein